MERQTEVTRIDIPFGDVFAFALKFFFANLIIFTVLLVILSILVAFLSSETDRMLELTR